MNELANDDWPEFAVRVIDPGPNRAVMVSLYRRLMNVGPAEAKRLLSASPVEVMRGRACSWKPTFAP